MSKYRYLQFKGEKIRIFCNAFVNFIATVSRFTEQKILYRETILSTTSIIIKTHGSFRDFVSHILSNKISIITYYFVVSAFRYNQNSTQTFNNKIQNKELDPECIHSHFSCVLVTRSRQPGILKILA